MAKPALKAALLSPQRDLGEKPLLLVGPSLGTSSILWNRAASLLGGDYDVVAWDLPGHGVSPAATEAFDVAALADAVVDLVDSIAPGENFHYAGVSLGGAVGLQLGIKHGARLKSLSVQNSGAKIGTPEGWLERAETVRTQGTPVMIQGSAERWFAPGFMDSQPELSSRLLHALRDADRFSYAFCCEALAAFDVRAELGSIRVPTQVIAGAVDGVATPAMADEVATGITGGGGTATAVTLEGVAHLAPAEAPAHVAELMRGLISWAESQVAAK
ncbi:alpha/beta hydrolase fold protein [Pseudarthrobacter chlorophenolicus A6]|uniref:Alpha/beta hydrolase fold protein n=1 Tax=Pseudarthrobacter chlorophenolicus (strain ATCC 700700 / DSM 12829 / CIP 107037 / JCM 12360 / KCTC 9906 / NCIMB 13794 / A6) TaxID=452863 RepID=B8H801_PSECP|nr:alpha/beta fold hydrolase [Pseudarthrobacter chlorophenolicus]ACL41804.1 alpha/beta hydrolase fold protein [Pseudarthrobacter chlorophenolicus A6]SDQ58197.1 3-oxoadipate enol-lactonase [Pseudarthrobacter chlorophenolicus]